MRTALSQPGTRPGHAYFLTAGIASRVAVTDGQRLEVGIIGREGMSDLCVPLRTDSMPYQVFMQVAGRGWRIETDALAAAAREHEALETMMLRWVHVSITHAAQAAVAGVRFTIEARLARWLLMLHDRLDTPRIDITHEFLSEMLGVHRPGVTLAVQGLEGRAAIRGERGRITVLDRAVLLAIAGDSYGVAEQEEARLLGEFRR